MAIGVPSQRFRPLPSGSPVVLNNPVQGKGNYFPQDPTTFHVRGLGDQEASWQRRVIDLSAARNAEEMVAAGTFIWVLDATDVNANIEIEFNTQRGDGLVFKLGMSVLGMSFSRMYLTNVAQPGKTTTLVYINAEFGPWVENPAATTSQITITPGSTVPSTADTAVAATTTAAVLAANTNRKKAFIHNLITNPREIRVGDTNITATRGLVVQPGGTVELDTTAQIFVHNPHSVAMSVSLLEIAS